jgi:ParB-like chromosome segregation protein Spo0J
MVEKSADYILIMHHAVRHVGLKLEGASGPLSFSDLTKGYEHPVPADLYRVKRHEKAADDGEAKAWVIRYAVSLLNGGLTVDGDMVSFAPSKGLDDLRWGNGKKVERPGPDIYAQLRDPFDPMSGVFSENIRIENGDTTELRESMKAWGWIDRPQFRALGDKRTKVVLIGHRRITVAKELGIDWEKHIDWIDIGDGDAADAERFKLAIASNIGAKALSPNDRKRLAAHLYSEHEWSMQKVADALGVAFVTVQRDLKELSIGNNSKRGRPRKEEPKSLVEKAAKNRRVTPDQEEQVAALVEQGLTTKEIADQVGIGHVGVQLAKARHIGTLAERERIAKAAASDDHTCTCPACGHVHPRGDRDG